MIGRTYLERGRPVTVLVRWRTGHPAGPRNVLIRREDGTKVVRPFRGLRKAGTPKNFALGLNDNPSGNRNYEGAR